MINKMMIFERRILREIFGPTRTDDGYWRIKTNQEINEIQGDTKKRELLKNPKKLKKSKKKKLLTEIEPLQLAF